MDEDAFSTPPRKWRHRGQQRPGAAFDQIMQRATPAGDWNIYVAQASDGDNFHDDGGNCRSLLVDRILPLVRYFAYVQVAQEGAESVGRIKPAAAAVPVISPCARCPPGATSIPCSATCLRKRGPWHEPPRNTRAAYAPPVLEAVRTRERHQRGVPVSLLRQAPGASPCRTPATGPSSSSSATIAAIVATAERYG